ncbi:MAG TPA: hypothetical protein VNC50_15475, partial [Planctomycetia bacterium]|nr:hypothetical protein [Planctomycetia bacterium]
SFYFPAGESVVRLHPEGLRVYSLLGIAEKGRAFVAARIKSVERDRDGWRLRLDPESGVLLTEPRILETLGVVGDPDAEKIRQKQLSLAVPPKSG